MQPTTGARQPVAIVNHLSRLMGERRINIQELSRRSGLSYKAVHDLYHDRTRRYDAETLDRLCRALACRVEDIIEYVPDAIEEPGDA
jgi:putative transcriptional regulator